MLSRTAEGVYRFGRELERVAAIARVLEVTSAVALDGAGSNGTGVDHVWNAAVAIAGEPTTFAERHVRAEGRSVAWYLSLSDWNPDAIATCIGRVKEHASAVRSLLPVEVFEAVGALAMAAGRWTPRRITRDGVFAFCHDVRDCLSRIDGTIDRYLRRDEHWELVRLGRFVERATQTARLLAVHGREARGPAGGSAGIGDWRVVLRVTGAYEAYLRVAAVGGDRPTGVAFLLLDRSLPTAVAFGLGEVFDALDALQRLGITPADAAPKAAVFAASRAAASAAQPSSFERGMERLETRMRELHEALITIFFPTLEAPDAEAFAQAARQAQN